jgi:hypothetical protein
MSLGARLLGRTEASIHEIVEFIARVAVLQRQPFSTAPGYPARRA